MSKFAVIQLGPKQYTVEEGKDYTVPKFQAEEGSKFEVENVLALGDEKDLKTGKDKSAKVTLEILSQEKGEKIKTKIFKAKSRYRRTRGHRKLVTKFKVAKIA